MIVHVLPDNKFVDDAIERFEAVAPGRNRFLVRRPAAAQGDLTLVTSGLAEKVRVGRLGPEFREPGVRAVVFHAFHASIHRLIHEVPEGVRIAWLGWGYDYYPSLLRERFPPPDGLLEPRTRQLRRALEGESAGPLPELDREALERVDWFIPVLRSEWALARQLNPWLRAGYLPWGYGTGRVERALPPPSQPRRAILVGNSAALTNNHLDTFDMLRAAGGTDTYDRVVVPLTYGPTEVTRRVVEAGRAAFGERFEPLTDHLPRDRYEELVASCHTLVFGHVRQQGLGNVSIAVRAGLRLVLHPRSILREDLIAAGIRTDRLDSFTPASLPRWQAVLNHHRYRAFRRDRRDPEATRRLVAALES